MGKACSEKIPQKLRIEIIKAPNLFRCPISLEIMRSPVSLCTGVTYDRSSIQRWLDSGHSTCPATMLPLPTTDLVPNLTLRRLINIWSAAKCDDNYAPADLVNDVRSLKLSEFLRDQDVEDSVKNGLICGGEFAKNIVYLILDGKHGVELRLKAVEVVDTILSSDWIEVKNREVVVNLLCNELDAVLNFVIGVLKDEETELEARHVCARVLRIVISASRPRILVSDKLDAIVSEVIRLVSEKVLIDEGLGCLVELMHSKRAMKLMVHYDLVQSLLEILAPECILVKSKSAEKAIMVLEAAANCTAGRVSINEVVGECVEIVMGRMMKIGKVGRDAAIGILWNICYNNKDNFGSDRKAKDAVALAKGGMAKILVVMQGDCAPTVRKMAAGLLRVFRADAKSLVAGYDTKTTHIMPF